MTSTLRAVLAAALAASAPATAFADTRGTEGKLVEVTINEASSDDYSKFHGSIVVKSGKETFSTFRWGGSNCPAADLSEANVSRLVDALIDRRSTVIIPHSKPGQGGNLCLVGFELQDKDSDVPG